MDKFRVRKWVVYLGLFSFSTGYAQTFQGSVNVIILDDLKNNQSKRLYQLQDKNKRYELTIPKNMSTKIKLKTGDQITIQGEIVKHGRKEGINVNSISVSQHAKVKANLIGQHNILALLVNFTDLKATDSTSTAAIDSAHSSSKCDNHFYTAVYTVRWAF